MHTIALIGRPNVGKSTLFNYLTHSKEALVADFPGLTRDRLYGHFNCAERAGIIIDTAGIAKETSDVEKQAQSQLDQAILDADSLFFMLDGKTGIVPEDERIAKKLRQAKKPVFVVVNKLDGADAAIVSAEFYQLGFADVVAISAKNGEQVATLMQRALPEPGKAADKPSEDEGIKMAIVGRPNVGKSTLVNRLLGEERVVASDMAHTTRDSVKIPFTHHNQRYTIIDTAGVRRKSRVDDTIEKFSVIKTLKAIDEASVVIFICDAKAGISAQDLHLLGFILESGSALIIAFNKIDGLTLYEKESLKNDISRQFTFLTFAKMKYISAKHGTGVGDLYPLIKEAHRSAFIKVKPSELTDLLAKAQEAHAPPLVNGRRIKLRYIHLGGYQPLTLVIHGNQTKKIPTHYTRFLENFFRQTLNLIGVPIKIIYKTQDNPFAHIKNKLTKRQLVKRKRLKDKVKKR